ncbi:methyltransferase [Chania multitudinisentens RB-25]|uniref:Methyltransferase n=1 Tax=Chania multitudinisentens RB-25 TaxID=1441930 RepID=W0LFK6_9GAMM|nr:class I SAM-dependent methyltransferase [Chania multitudinisentens]AHG22501.1 methyltransferase [Chania multitudinisentens RB-25]
MTDCLAKNIITIYEKLADNWEQLRSTDLFEQPWLDKFLNLLPVNGQILDIGCGNGVPIAEYFIRQNFQVVGVDSSQSMIGHCQQRFPEQLWNVADMRLLALHQKFDGLIAWDSFFHLTREDQRNMFRVFKRHANSKAVLMFTSGPSDGEVVGVFEGEQLYHASLAPAEYRQLLKNNGFSVIDMIAEDPECRGRTVWLAQHDSDDD